MPATQGYSDVKHESATLVQGVVRRHLWRRNVALQQVLNAWVRSQQAGRAKSLAEDAFTGLLQLRSPKASQPAPPAQWEMDRSLQQEVVVVRYRECVKHFYRAAGEARRAPRFVLQEVTAEELNQRYYQQRELERERIVADQLQRSAGRRVSQALEPGALPRNRSLHDLSPGHVRKEIGVINTAKGARRLRLDEGARLERIANASAPGVGSAEGLKGKRALASLTREFARAGALEALPQTDPFGDDDPLAESAVSLGSVDPLLVSPMASSRRSSAARRRSSLWFGGSAPAPTQQADWTTKSAKYTEERMRRQSAEATAMITSPEGTVDRLVAEAEVCLMCGLPKGVFKYCTMTGQLHIPNARGASTPPPAPVSTPPPRPILERSGYASRTTSPATDLQRPPRVPPVGGRAQLPPLQSPAARQRSSTPPFLPIGHRSPIPSPRPSAWSCVAAVAAACLLTSAVSAVCGMHRRRPTVSREQFVMLTGHEPRESDEEVDEVDAGCPAMLTPRSTRAGATVGSGPPTSEDAVLCGRMAAPEPRRSSVTAPFQPSTATRRFTDQFVPTWSDARDSVVLSPEPLPHQYGTPPVSPKDRLKDRRRQRLLIGGLGHTHHRQSSSPTAQRKTWKARTDEHKERMAVEQTPQDAPVETPPAAKAPRRGSQGRRASSASPAPRGRKPSVK
eukprot:TRINITY_DN24741_c0_g1_i1.p1 TRINITY_DN24741_c0_g1~~TRINITY_DN24741_c0_g1_i1.p1  ORF type:complete len:696 (+),score=182.79 TRINITY_DN24741_c0_g1_i1:53-2089(+)